MAIKSKNLKQGSGSEVRDLDRGDGQVGRNVPQARQRVRYNKAGEELTGAIGTRFPRGLYEEYKRIAFFKGVDVRDLIGEAMKVYLPELKNGHAQRLRDAGQAELDMAAE